MSNHTPAAGTVHLDQLNARKRKQSRDDAVDLSLDMDIDVDESPSCSSDTAMDVGALRAPPGGLSIDVAAAAAASSTSCYRGNPSSASPSYASTRPASPTAFRPAPPSPSSSSSAASSSSSRTAKCTRLSVLTHSMPPSPITPTERHRRRRRRKELGSKRRLARLYNKRPSQAQYTFPYRFPDGFVRKAPAASTPHSHFQPHVHPHTHTHAHAHEGFSMSLQQPSSSSGASVLTSSSSFSGSSAATHYSSLPYRRRASSPSVLQSVPGPSSSQNCLHQSCVAFRFASMIDGVQLSSLSTSRTGAPSQGRSGSFYVPPILPPINRYTLQELDLDAIMKNPQLRTYLSESEHLDFI